VAIAGWILDKSAAARSEHPQVARHLRELAGTLHVCSVGELEQLYSARSAADYDRLASEIRETFQVVAAPPDILDRALTLQRDLAHHHGMWHRTPIPDLLIAETALFHGLGIVHVDRDYERISEVRGLVVRRVG
jgi:predicted nucleic acid-binding protein